MLTLSKESPTQFGEEVTKDRAIVGQTSTVPFELSRLYTDANILLVIVVYSPRELDVQTIRLLPVRSLEALHLCVEFSEAITPV